MSLHELNKETSTLKCVFLYPSSVIALIHGPYHSRTLNNRVNKLYERCINVIYSDKKSAFRKFLDKDRLFQYTIEICKSWQQKCKK